MNTLSELESWRARQLEEYQHAQIIDRLDKLRLLDEYQGAQAIDRLDRQNAGLSLLGSILGDTGTSVGLIQADVARLLAVTDQALPVIVGHLALVGDRLAVIQQLLSSPEETKAWELFRSGSHALTSAKEMFGKGAQDLANDLLNDAIKDISRAVKTYRYRPEFWYLLGVAHAFRGPSEDAAEAFSRCSRYAASDSPHLAAASVLLAAAQFRSIGQQAKARDLLHEFLPPLDRCAEIHLNLAKHYGEPERLKRALELAPLLAAVARAGRVASVEEAAAEVCRCEDGPVSRLRKLEDAIHRLVAAAKRIGLDCFSDPLASIDLPNFGVDALLKAEENILLLGEQGKKFADDVRTGLEQLEARVRDCWQRYQAAVTSGNDQVREARQRAARAKQRARERSKIPLAVEIQKKDKAERAYRFVEKKFQQATSKSVEARKILDAYIRIYDENGKIRPEALKRFREIWNSGKKTAKLRTGDEDYDYLLDWHCASYGERLHPNVALHMIGGRVIKFRLNWNARGKTSKMLQAVSKLCCSRLDVGARRSTWSSNDWSMAIFAASFRSQSKKPTTHASGSCNKSKEGYKEPSLDTTRHVTNHNSQKRPWLAFYKHWKLPSKVPRLPGIG